MLPHGGPRIVSECGLLRTQRRLRGTQKAAATSPRHLARRHPEAAPLQGHLLFPRGCGSGEPRAVRNLGIFEVGQTKGDGEWTESRQLASQSHGSARLGVTAPRDITGNFPCVRLSTGALFTSLLSKSTFSLKTEWAAVRRASSGHLSYQSTVHVVTMEECFRHCWRKLRPVGLTVMKT